MKNIAFVSAGWPYAIFTLDLALALTAAGVGVYVYYEDTVENMVDWDVYASHPGITLKKIHGTREPQNTPQQSQLYIRHLYQELLTHGIEDCHGIIGIEKKGGALANAVGMARGIPHVYWSLEIYDSDHPWTHIPCGPFWLNMEAAAVQRTKAVIIQDSWRAAAFEKMTGCSSHYLYLPVTASDADLAPSGSKALHSLLGINPDLHILFQYGNNRIPQQNLLIMASALPNDWRLVLHGFGLHGLSATLQHPRLIFSCRRLPQQETPQLVASASAGLVHYEPTHINNELTAWASEKLARYLRTGIPILAYDVGNFKKLLERYSCGVLYNSPEAIGHAVRCIAAHADHFHQQALLAGKEYSMAHVGRPVVDFLCRMVNATATGLRPTLQYPQGIA